VSAAVVDGCKNTLELYDGVPTLQLLQQLSIPVVAYTDAIVANSLFRLERLNIKRYFSALYAPNHPGRLLDPSAGGFVQLLNPKDRKPNPATLLDICSRFAIAPEQTFYIGDSYHERWIYGVECWGSRSAGGIWHDVRSYSLAASRTGHPLDPGRRRERKTTKRDSFQCATGTSYLIVSTI
jgi:FMN phosphatase YigB (HAD superfamily)